jgi:TolB protein
MEGSGSRRAPLTNESSDDRPSWSPDGAFVAFMSSGRHGNPEIYTVNTTSGAVTRLTENSSVDALPAVSPDGEWVAFVSNRDGGWKIYAVPSGGGSAVPIAPVSGIVDWVKHGIQWTY